MFEIGMKVVCVKPAEAVWFPDIPPELCPTNVPVTGGIYTVREVIMGSTEVNGAHWTKAPGVIGLLFQEIRNEPVWTTNGAVEEQGFHEADFMPLDERESITEDDVSVRVTERA